MTEKEQDVLTARIAVFNEKTKDIIDNKKYNFYADEGGMIGIPRFLLINKEIKNKIKIPQFFIYQCDSNGFFIRTYIKRLIELWNYGGQNYLKSFGIEVINK